LIHRVAVDFETPHVLAAVRIEPPGMTIAAGTFWSPQPLPLRPRPLEARQDPRSETFRFEFRLHPSRTNS
jgi:hypothetical protein